MTKQVIIARHGNNFAPGEEVKRIGFGTDLPLAGSGPDQARALGRALRTENFVPQMVWTSELQRTWQTAELALFEIGVRLDYEMLVDLNEIDYGPDENQAEAKVRERIGDMALKKWEEEAILPPGWQATRKDMVRLWCDLFDEIALSELDRYLIITSNGVARYALLAASESRRHRFPLKLATGAFGEIEIAAPGLYKVTRWNVRPEIT